MKKSKSMRRSNEAKEVKMKKWNHEGLSKYQNIWTMKRRAEENNEETEENQVKKREEISINQRKKHEKMT